MIVAMDTDAADTAGPALDIIPAGPSTWPALEDLFGRAGASNGCWCMYWRLGPRYHERPREQNRAALRELVDGDAPPGLIAFTADRAVGWCQVTSRTDVPWLDHARYLAPVDEVPVWSITCFFVRRGYRGRGVASALIDEAVRLARAAGAPAVEAYPVDTAAPKATRNVFTGTAAMFRRAGFTTVAARVPARPIMRRQLS